MSKKLSGIAAPISTPFDNGEIAYDRLRSNVQKYSETALAGFFAGVAGALHAYLYRGAGIESFTLHQSISYLAMAIVGGLGTISGSFFGPAAIQLLDLQVEHLATWAASFMPPGMSLATALKPLSFGLVIVLFLIFEPRGIANWWRIIRSYFKLWPFRY